MNAIELLLYGDSGFHRVTNFSISPGAVRVRLLPWDGPQVLTEAV